MHRRGLTVVEVVGPEGVDCACDAMCGLLCAFFALRGEKSGRGRRGRRRRRRGGGGGGRRRAGGCCWGHGRGQLGVAGRLLCVLSRGHAVRTRWTWSSKGGAESPRGATLTVTFSVRPPAPTVTAMVSLDSPGHTQTTQSSPRVPCAVPAPRSEESRPRRFAYSSPYTRSTIDSPALPADELDDGAFDGNDEEYGMRRSRLSPRSSH